MIRFAAFVGGLLTVTSTAMAFAAAPTAPVPLTTPAPPITWQNPLVPQRADPHVTLHTDGYYYLAATVPAYDRIELRRARSLAGLAIAEPRTIWQKRSTGPMGAHIWAPELHFIDGRWYVHFAAGDAEQIWRIRMYVLEAEAGATDPLTATWTEKGQIHTHIDGFALDATTFAHRGTRYLVWTERGPPDGTNIYLAAMSNPWTLTGPQVAISRPEFDWERRGHRVNEAPAVLARHGRIFITYSASATDANYCLGLLTADETADLLAPASWTKSPAPVFASHAPSSQFGPGHNSFTTTPDGRTDLLVYHARNYERIQGEPLNNPDRATRAQVLRWSAEGTPIFDPPVPDGYYEVR